MTESLLEKAEIEIRKAILKETNERRESFLERAKRNKSQKAFTAEAINHLGAEICKLEEQILFLLAELQSRKHRKNGES